MFTPLNKKEINYQKQFKRAKKESKKCKSPNEWKTKYRKSYTWAIRNKNKDKKVNDLWNKFKDGYLLGYDNLFKRAKKESKKCKTPKEWETKYSKSYSWAIKNRKKYKEVNDLWNKIKDGNLLGYDNLFKRAKKESKKCKTPNEWKTKYRKSYTWAIANRKKDKKVNDLFNRLVASEKSFRKAKKAFLYFGSVFGEKDLYKLGICLAHNLDKRLNEVGLQKSQFLIYGTGKDIWDLELKLKDIFKDILGLAKKRGQNFDGYTETFSNKHKEVIKKEIMELTNNVSFKVIYP